MSLFLHCTTIDSYIWTNRIRTIIEIFLHDSQKYLKMPNRFFCRNIGCKSFTVSIRPSAQRFIESLYVYIYPVTLQLLCCCLITYSNYYQSTTKIKAFSSRNVLMPFSYSDLIYVIYGLLPAIWYSKANLTLNFLILCAIFFLLEACIFFLGTSNVSASTSISLQVSPDF
jgi:hypothetical protein